jgi:hypothetical protein
MSTANQPAASEAQIWELIIHPRGPMSRATAEQILAIEFTADERERMKDLAERNRRGEASEVDADELDNFCRVGNTLSLLKSRARQILKKRRR